MNRGRKDEKKKLIDNTTESSQHFQDFTIKNWEIMYCFTKKPHYQSFIAF